MNFDLYKRIHTSFKDVVYFDDIHAYYSNGKRGVSVTTIKKKFMEEFDTQYWTVHEAMKRLFPPVNDQRRVLSHARKGIPDQHISLDGNIKHLEYWATFYKEQAGLVKAEWDLKSYERRIRGSQIHRYLELGTYGKYDTSERIEACDRFIEEKAHQIPLALELIVASPCRRIMGQLDRLTYDPCIDGIELSDFKTDEVISFFDKYGKKMKWPFNMLDDTNGNGYIVQLNTYRNFLESIGIPIKKMTVYNIREEEKTYIEVDIPFIEISVDKMLDDNPRRAINFTRGITSTRP